MKNYSYEKGIAIVKKWEGCKLTAYKCPAGVWTIGYGHTNGVKEGDTITLAQADAFLEEDIKSVTGSPRFRTFCEMYDLNNNQANALMSFCYNGGLGWLAQVSDNYKRDVKTIGEKMLLYVKANGTVLQGLVNRRKDEYALYITPDEGQTTPNASEIGKVVLTIYDKSGNVLKSYEI